MNKINIPPIKSQGIKTKLVPWIKNIIPQDFSGNWIEPFMGTGVVGFNLAPTKAIMADINPHLINFYSNLATGKITPKIVKDYLQHEGEKLLTVGEKHYYYIRDRFNTHYSSLDFLFLNRAGFNGMIRFNKKGQFNVPFCRKPQRFAQAYITKIVNQVNYLSQIFITKQFIFRCQNFTETISQVSPNDLIYCDPPYIDRHLDYYNGWDSDREQTLFNTLSQLESKFILSTWHHNDFRANEYVQSLWSKYHILTKEHFYHVGGKEENRNPVLEALITNFSPLETKELENKLK